jgi:DNA polymerase III epsilon subunit-like protein
VKIIVLDTETAGLPRDYKAPATDAANWPRVVQIAWQVYDGEQLIAGESHLIKPQGFEIPAAATAVHGITTATAAAQGLELTRVLDTLRVLANVTDAVICHNASFDLTVLAAEYARLGQASPFARLRQICTMTAATPLLRLPGKYGWKFPKLDELHRYLFNTDFDGAHDAMRDVQATARCFFELRRRGVITL